MLNFESFRPRSAVIAEPLAQRSIPMIPASLETEKPL